MTDLAKARSTPNHRDYDRAELAAEEAGYRDLPVYYDFGEKKDEILRANFMRINQEVETVVAKFRKVPPQVQVIPKGSMKA